VKTARRLVYHCSRNDSRRVVDDIAIEEPLEIRIDSEPLVVTMRTPGHDHELAAGFLYSEGIICSHNQIQVVRLNPRNRSSNSLDVFLSPDAHVDRNRFTRRGIMSSSCGVCGRESIRAIRRQFPAAKFDGIFRSDVLLRLPAALRQAQPTFERTGGLHAAGIFTRDGELIVAREDIGRHNAVDKVIGYGLLNGLLPFRRHVLIVSGRASFEIMQKSLSAQIPAVCAVSAPSSLAVEFARASRQTLIGFLREARLNIYSGAKRVRFSRK
jgi:FdhD protein